MTIKRLEAVEGKLALLPKNPQFKPIIPEDGDTLEVWGIVTNYLRQFRRRSG